MNQNRPFRKFHHNRIKHAHTNETREQLTDKLRNWGKSFMTKDPNFTGAEEKRQRKNALTELNIDRIHLSIKNDSNLNIFNRFPSLKPGTLKRSNSIDQVTTEGPEADASYYFTVTGADNKAFTRETSYPNLRSSFMLAKSFSFTDMDKIKNESMV